MPESGAERDAAPECCAERGESADGGAERGALPETSALKAPGLRMVIPETGLASVLVSLPENPPPDDLPE